MVVSKYIHGWKCQSKILFAIQIYINSKVNKFKLETVRNYIIVQATHRVDLRHNSLIM